MNYCEFDQDAINQALVVLDRAYQQIEPKWQVLSFLPDNSRVSHILSKFIEVRCKKNEIKSLAQRNGLNSLQESQAEVVFGSREFFTELISTIAKRTTQMTPRQRRTEISGLTGGNLKFMLGLKGEVSLPASRLFCSLGIPLYEMLWVEESIIPIALNSPGHFRLGSAGRIPQENSLIIGTNGRLFLRSRGLAKRFQGLKEHVEISAQGFRDESGYLYVWSKKRRNSKNKEQ